ncbi:hypothetical protein ACJX0J_009027, partial [Zea mays]
GFILEGTNYLIFILRLMKNIKHTLYLVQMHRICYESGYTKQYQDDEYNGTEGVFFMYLGIVLVISLKNHFLAKNCHKLHDSCLISTKIKIVFYIWQNRDDSYEEFMFFCATIHIETHLINGKNRQIKELR